MSDYENQAHELVSRFWHSFPEQVTQPIAVALATAEERGFRRGIECAARALENPILPGDPPWPEAAELVRALLPGPTMFVCAACSWVGAEASHDDCNALALPAQGGLL